MKKSNVIEFRTPFSETPCGQVLTAAFTVARANDRRPAAIAVLQEAAQYTGDPERFRLLSTMQDETEQQLKPLLARVEFDGKLKPEIQELQARQAKIQPELVEWLGRAWAVNAQTHRDQSWAIGREPIAELVRQRYLPALETLATIAEEIVAACDGLPRPFVAALPILQNVRFPDEARFSELVGYARSLQKWGIEWDPTRVQRSGGMPPAA